MPVPHCLNSASFQDLRILSSSERGSLAKLAPQLTLKACFPSSIERQNVRLVLKVFNALTLSALEIQNENVVKDIVIIPLRWLESLLLYGKYSMLVHLQAHTEKKLAANSNQTNVFTSIVYLANFPYC
ncbi:Transposable element P transposase [Oopsacas minuta]|uniref:Transposable element P transposase n=1 Tax=Oopsacas minuta TaxID=111878 RepID=A0AAV7JV87_9METZ|nr:Transposable element P transposase [Oopsacas minuta]